MLRSTRHIPLGGLWLCWVIFFSVGGSVLMVQSQLASEYYDESNEFQEYRFQDSVRKAMKSVQRILDTTRNPRLAEEEEDHTYDDKFALAEFLTNTAVAATMNALDLGLGFFGGGEDGDEDEDRERFFSDIIWQQVHESKKTVTLRLEADDSCQFVKEEEVKIQTNHDTVESTTTTMNLFSNANAKSKTTTIYKWVKRFHWRVGLNVRWILFIGNDPANAAKDDNNSSSIMELHKRHSSKVIITSGGKEASPFPEKTIHEPIDIDITWLLQMVSKDKKMAHFSIDRFSSPQAMKTCKTPRRNQDIASATLFFSQLRIGVAQILSFFQYVGELEGGEDPKYLYRIMEIRDLAPSFFYPTLPLLENSTLLSGTDFEALLNEQARTIEFYMRMLSGEDNEEEDGDSLSFTSVVERLFSGEENEEGKQNEKKDGDSLSVISVVEAKMILICEHVDAIAVQYFDSINYIEKMLERQLYRAIGKEITADDFQAFIRIHYQKLFGASYAPKLFSYAVRRPDHYPDGMVAIEAKASREPVQTWTRQVRNTANNSPVWIPINAATSVEVKGDTFLHGWMQHRFKASSPSSSLGLEEHFHLAARAHQFSSFLLIVGSMAGPDRFQPKSAIILQNKDEVLIPLLTEVLPSAKEFKNAILSLSPEQQEFAKAFRAMQLESSVFGICVIQLKPQMEKLLGLPPDSLTKEIQLTQDLMSLFIDYQIPSDLLGVSGGDAYLSSSSSDMKSNAADKLNAVKSNVKAVKDVIDQAKEEYLREEKRKAEMKDNMNPTRSPGASRWDSPSTSPELSPSASSSTASPGAAPSASADVSPGAAPSSLPRNLSPVSGPTGSTTQASSSSSKQRSLRAASAEGGGAPEVPVPPPTTPGNEENMYSSSSSKTGEDFTLIPQLLDAKIERQDPDGSLRSTVIKVGQSWRRRRQENLLTPSVMKNLANDNIKTEQQKAFDLLDALSRSGSLAIDGSELHIVVAVSHCFEADILDTIIKDNINPIEKVEDSALLLASTIHKTEIMELIGDQSEARKRFAETVPPPAI